MEDLNTVAADCLVISCCCQCLILQILIVILLKLPFKLFRKTIHYAKKLRNRKRGERIVHTRRKRADECPFRVPEGSVPSNECHKFQSCMDEVEKVLEEFCLRGEFGFGRFWDGDEVSCGSCGSCGSFRTCLGNDHQQLDYDVVSYHLIQMFASSSCTDQSLIL